MTTFTRKTPAQMNVGDVVSFYGGTFKVTHAPVESQGHRPKDAHLTTGHGPSDCASTMAVCVTGEIPGYFKHSANTAYDMSQNVFSCHDSGIHKAKTCAGFLLRGADHNLAVRLGRMTGKFGDDVRDGGIELHDSYRAMAVANGVDRKDPALKNCR